MFLNGMKINEWIDDDPNVDLATGHIGLQMHGAGDDVFFRNVRVRELEESVDTPGTVGGTVPATLSLTLGAPASFGTFMPATDRTYEAATSASVTSSAGDAALSVSPQPAYLANGTFTLSEPLQVAVLEGGVDGAGVQRPGDDRVPPAHRRDAGVAHRQLQQDADVHALDDEPVSVPVPAAASAAAGTPRASAGVKDPKAIGLRRIAIDDLDRRPRPIARR